MSTNYIASVSYSDASHTDTTGARITSWTARIVITMPLLGLQRAYQQTQQLAPNPRRPLADKLTVTASSLDEARASAVAALEQLTGLTPQQTRYMDLRALNARPAAVEEFKLATERRKAA
jgi:hypothetical protein